MDNTVWFDEIQSLIWALGSSEVIHQDISLIYEKKENEYYKFYKESKYYNDPFFQSFSTKTMEIMKMITGILLKEQDENKNEMIIKLIKKGYKDTYNFVLHKSYVDFELLAKRYSNKNKENIEQFSQHLAVAIYLVIHLDKDYDDSTETIKLGLQTLQDQIELFKSKNEFIKKIIKEHSNNVELEKVSLKILNKKERSPGDIAFLYSDNDLAERSLFPGNFENYSDFEIQCFTGGFTKYLSGIGGFTRGLGLNNFEILRSVKVKPEQIDFVFAYYYDLVHFGQLEENEKNMYLAYSLFILALSEEYKQTREKYLEQFKDKFYYELNKLNEATNSQQNQIEKQMKEFNEKKAEMNKEKALFEYKRKQLQKELEQYKGIVPHLEKKLEKYEANQKELYALREYLFSRKNEKIEYDLVNENRLEEMTEFLKTFKIVIVGGHPQWQNKIKVTFNEFIFISAEELGRDFSFLDKADAVFINTSYNSHSLYRRVMNQLNKNNVLISYFNQSMNVDRLIQEMYNALKIK